MNGLKGACRTDREKITVTGIIVPVVWDEKGNPVSMAIATYAEQEYLINARTKKGKELQQLVRQKVRVTGILDSSASGRRTLTIQKFTKLNDSDGRVFG